MPEISEAARARARELVEAFGQLPAVVRDELTQAIRERADEIGGNSPEEVIELEAAASAVETLTASPGPSRIRRMAQLTGHPSASPEAAATRQSGVLTAAGGLGADTLREGDVIPDRDALGKLFTDVIGNGRGARTGRTLVASARWTYPEERRFTGDPVANARLVDRVVHPDVLVASGGICAPVNVDYSVATWATADRPLRDGLPAFQADRGGITFVPPPSIAALASATEVWTEATDANPADATKPVLAITCGSPTTVYLDAVPTRLQFGNMMARFEPEWMAANVDLAAAAAARTAENNVLSLIAAAATANVTTAILLGATRDLITAVYQAAAQLRSQHRIPRSVMLTGIFPDWLRDMVRVDLAREIGHSQNDNFNSLALADDQVDDMLAAAGIKPIWHIDGQAQDGGTYPSQVFASQTTSEAIETFPAKVVWYLAPEGSIQFLDGGRLDLGVVRDSVLDSTNDFELFVESFEAVAFKGFTGALTQFVSSLCANGASAGTESTTSDCA